MLRMYEHFLSRKSPLILPVISRILFNSRFVELYSLSHLLDASLLGVGNECQLISTVLLALHTSKMQWGVLRLGACLQKKKRVKLIPASQMSTESITLPATSTFYTFYMSPCIYKHCCKWQSALIWAGRGCNEDSWRPISSDWCVYLNLWQYGGVQVRTDHRGKLSGAWQADWPAVWGPVWKTATKAERAGQLQSPKNWYSTHYYSASMLMSALVTFSYPCSHSEASQMERITLRRQQKTNNVSKCPEDSGYYG